MVRILRGVDGWSTEGNVGEENEASEGGRHQKYGERTRLDGADCLVFICSLLSSFRSQGEAETLFVPSIVSRMGLCIQ